MPGEAPGLDRGAVVDASALAAIIFGEPGFERIAESISRCPWTVTTSLLEFEVHNVGLVKARRREASEKEVLRAMREAVYPPTRAVDFAGAFQLASDHGLTFYDAAYLQLAVDLNVPLLTLDSQLLQADPRRCVDPSTLRDLAPGAE